ncbi:MAG: hypothetical protein ABSH37_21230 [Bryobacteraceae bacterium]|jgi:hypothetical protein
MNPILYFRILLPVAALAVALPCVQLAQDREAGANANSLAGTWRGICRDGSPFVILNLKISGKDVTGNIAIANMNGDAGQCVSVIDPPSPEHAMKIGDAKLEGKTLSFQGSPNARFQMSLDGTQTAKLKFLGTPVEDTPWQLTK